MRRLWDLDSFYEMLYELVDHFGLRTLGTHGSDAGWCERGVYFFFEPGEERSSSASGPRVTRVGTHAIVAHSKTHLWNRLSTHRGVISHGGGNHRGSVFRLLVGDALIARDKHLGLEYWGLKRSAPKEMTLADKDLEREHEKRVSEYIRKMPLTFLPVLDSPSRFSHRLYIERNSTALPQQFSLQGSRDKLDPPSQNWLGNYSTHPAIRGSGLWNDDHVTATYDPEFLRMFRTLVDAAKINRPHDQGSAA